MECVHSVDTYYINSSISFLSHRANASEYLTISRLLFTALVALSNLTSLSFSKERKDWLGRLAVKVSVQLHNMSIVST